MNSQMKEDLAAGTAVLIMFVGAFTLMVTSLGLLLIAAGAILILMLVLKALRKEP